MVRPSPPPTNGTGESKFIHKPVKTKLCSVCSHVIYMLSVQLSPKFLKYVRFTLRLHNYEFMVLRFKIGNLKIDKKESIDLLGVNLDNKLNFSKHVSNICQRVHNQIQVITRFRNILCDSTKARLYKAFIMPHFMYCSTIWHFCGARNCEKLELLNKFTLRIILGPFR